MARTAKLVALALLAVVGPSVHAAYYYPEKPVGFSGTPGNWTFSPPSGAEQIDKIMRQSGGGGLKVPAGGSIKNIPLGYKLKVEAAKIAAAVIYRHPAVRVAVGIAAWLGAEIIWDEFTKTWREVQPMGTVEGLRWRSSGFPEAAWQSSPQAACAAGEALQSAFSGGDYSYSGGTPVENNSLCKYMRTPIKWQGNPQEVWHGLESKKVDEPYECPTGWTPGPGVCLSPALDQPKFVEKLNPENQPWTMPETVPGELPPGTPLPVEVPIFNPSPGSNPQPQPLLVPTGDPVRNPDYDPSSPVSPSNQPWVQPGVRIKPSPTPLDPLRVDIEPVNRPVQSPDPMPEPVTEPVPVPGQPNPSDNDKPKEDPFDLCKEHPDIVACAKMDDVDPTDVNNEDRNLSITPRTGFGADNASCPAPVVRTVAGLNLEMSWEPMCKLAEGIRPIVIALAWLSAAAIVIGVSRRGD